MCSIRDTVVPLPAATIRRRTPMVPSLESPAAASATRSSTTTASIDTTNGSSLRCSDETHLSDFVASATDRNSLSRSDPGSDQLSRLDRLGLDAMTIDLGSQVLILIDALLT